MSLNEIVYNLADLMGLSDDTVLLERLKFNVLYYRDLLMRRDDERSFRIPDKLLQSLDLVPVADGALWSKAIPTVCEAKKGPAITYVGPSDFSGSYGQCRREELSYVNAATYTRAVPRFCLYNDKLVVTEDDSVRVRAVFYDPREVMVLNGIFDTDDAEFPITGALVQRITAGMMSGELVLKTTPVPVVTI